MFSYFSEIFIITIVSYIGLKNVKKDETIVTETDRISINNLRASKILMDS